MRIEQLNGLEHEFIGLLRGLDEVRREAARIAWSRPESQLGLERWGCCWKNAVLSSLHCLATSCAWVMKMLFVGSLWSTVAAWLK